VSRSHRYRAFFISSDVELDRAIALGVEWLVQQPGEGLILLHAKRMIDNNRLLGQLARQYGIRCEAPQTIWKRSWRGGAILAPWASADVIRCIDDELGHELTAVCIIGSRRNDPNHEAWVASRNATDVISGKALGKRTNSIVSDPVVRVALDHAERFVNHNNALVQAEDKAYLVRMLQELVHGGHPFDLDAVAAYAMATGWTALEVKRIQEYGRRVLDRRSFRLESGVGPKAGDCKRWEAEATAAK
jgi:hypothetical protein